MHLSLTGIKKSFSGVPVLKGVQLCVEEGQIHALMGENGAGKSTLIKIITAVYEKDSGLMFIDGKEVSPQGIKDSQELGIAYVHQELNMVNDLSVYENMFLGQELSKNGFLLKEKMQKIAREKLDYLGLHGLSEKALVRPLSVGLKQMIEIAKALLIDAKLIILDEPTAALSDKEAKRLFDIILELKAQGMSFLYVSHRMEEVFYLADEISVLRDGSYVGSRKRQETNQQEIVSLMLGKNVQLQAKSKPAHIGKVVLEAKDLSKAHEFSNISFFLKEGEVLGFAGLMGAGRSELVNAIFGATRLDSGKLYLEGKEVEISSPIEATKLGLALVSEDRKERGLILEASIKDNIALASLKNFLKGLFVDEEEVNKTSKKYIHKLLIRCKNKYEKVKQLSGGNQQKVVLAKCLATKPKILILDEPTRGVDIGAKKEIYELIQKLKEQGLAIILISSELTEVVGNCDRVAVMREGKLAGFLQGDEIGQEAILNLAFLKEEICQ